MQNAAGNSVVAYFNDGTGNFTQSASYAVGLNPGALVATQLQGQAQGYDDLAVVYGGPEGSANSPLGVTVLLNPLAK